jgi:hypothetical protein
MALLDNLTTQVNLAWDPSEINAVSSEIEGFDPSDYGFDPSQYATGPAADPNEADKVKEDDFDPDAEHYEPVTRQGDIWLLGNHRLMCGDSTKTEDVARLMQGEKADLWLTDPPYNVDYNSKNDYLNKVGKGGAVQLHGCTQRGRAAHSAGVGMEQEQLRARSLRLPTETRTLSIRMERGSRPLLHRSA